MCTSWESQAKIKHLRVKEPLNIWLPHLELNYIYHVYNGIFYEQPFKTAIKESIQTISFCGVLSHPQNYIVERKNQLPL